MSISKLSPVQFLNSKIAIVDVRSPGEFAQAHIPGAHNIPIFTNEERAIVGTLYKKSGKESAVLRGLEIVGPKMATFVKQARKIAPSKKIAVHCWRGGMRSESMAWLFSTSGLEVSLLVGGYKAYRAYIRESFSLNYSLNVLGGMTGSGKTDVLLELQKNGEQIIDLEGLANHKGSAFGGIGQQPQPTSEQFENNLYEIWKNFDFSKPIWIEDESRSIGRTVMPDTLFKKIRNSNLIVINIPKEERVKRILKDYGCYEISFLMSALCRIERRLGGAVFNDCVKALNQGDITFVIKETLKYYDKAYNFNMAKRDIGERIEISFSSGDPAFHAKFLAEYFSK